MRLRSCGGSINSGSRDDFLDLRAPAVLARDLVQRDFLDGPEDVWIVRIEHGGAVIAPTLARAAEKVIDMVCQELTATALLLKSAATKLSAENPAAAETLNESAQTVNRNVGVARDLARGLQAVDLSAGGLKTALRALALQACENRDLTCTFKAGRGVRVGDDTVALHLYRIAQEAVTNALKHSRAENVLISLDHDAENVYVTVQDDGKGFASRQRYKGLGLHIMKYRANVLGGRLKIQKRRSGGTEIKCVIPLKR